MSKVAAKDVPCANLINTGNQLNDIHLNTTKQRMLDMKKGSRKAWNERPPETATNKAKNKRKTRRYLPSRKRNLTIDCCPPSVPGQKQERTMKVKRHRTFGTNKAFLGSKIHCGRRRVFSIPGQIATSVYRRRKEETK